MVLFPFCIFWATVVFKRRYILGCRPVGAEVEVKIILYFLTSLIIRT